mmetsp:Transcript_1888/g.6908  ORF Transcript_1888/g.6908 Transcript_1888/m.6908 type:complete len:282 (+) Transcript_1888:3-848(+)
MADLFVPTLRFDPTKAGAAANGNQVRSVSTVRANGGSDGIGAARAAAPPPPPPPPPAVNDAVTAERSAPVGSTSGVKVYVGGLPYNYGEEEVRGLFEECGIVSSATLLNFPDSGRFRGIAILEFSDADGAAEAVKWNDTELEGRYIVVKPWEEKAPAPAAATQREPLQTAGTENRKAYVGNLHWDTDEAGLRDFFKGCAIREVYLGRDKATGEFKGYAHIYFASEEDIKRGLSFSGSVYLGREVKVAVATPPKTPSAGAEAGKKRSASGPGPKGGGKRRKN